MQEFYYTVGECDYRKDMAELITTGTNVLFPASSFFPRGRRLPKLPTSYPGLRAADSGGFVASFKHDGQYQYSLDQYAYWLSQWRPDWAAMMDFCCEDEITKKRPGIVGYRQLKTCYMAEQCWADYREVSWVWVPTIQGWKLDEYCAHAAQLAPLIKEMQAFYEQRGQGHLFRVGIGTLCRRAKVKAIIQIAKAVSAELPGVRLHLWGVKLDTFKSQYALPEAVLSADSAAWNGDFYSDRGKWKPSGMSRSKYGYKVALPVYADKLAKAFNNPKQLSLAI